jgi:putative membrane protein
LIYQFVNYLQFLVTSLALLAAGLAVYVFVTPYNEIQLIRNGCRAAAFSLGGTAIGLALPIYSVSSQSWHLRELAGWSVVALLTQIIAFVIVALVLGWGNLRDKMAADSVAHGIAVGMFSIAVGLLNAAALVA